MMMIPCIRHNERQSCEDAHFCSWYVHKSLLGLLVSNVHRNHECYLSHIKVATILLSGFKDLLAWELQEKWSQRFYDYDLVMLTKDDGQTLEFKEDGRVYFKTPTTLPTSPSWESLLPAATLEVGALDSLLMDLDYEMIKKPSLAMGLCEFIVFLRDAKAKPEDPPLTLEDQMDYTMIVTTKGMVHLEFPEFWESMSKNNMTIDVPSYVTQGVLQSFIPERLVAYLRVHYGKRREPEDERLLREWDKGEDRRVALNVAYLIRTRRQNLMMLYDIYRYRGETTPAEVQEIVKTRWRMVLEALDPTQKALMVSVGLFMIITHAWNSHVRVTPALAKLRLPSRLVTDNKGVLTLKSAAIMLAAIVNDYLSFYRYWKVHRYDGMTMAVLMCTALTATWAVTSMPYALTAASLQRGRAEKAARRIMERRDDKIRATVQELGDEGVFDSTMDACSAYPQFCQGGLGREREVNPQESVASLRALGQEHPGLISETTTVIRDLKVIQKQINLKTVERIMGRDMNFFTKNPIVISRDDYVLDGHHRFMAMKLNGMDDVEIPVIVVELPVDRAIDVLNSHMDSMGTSPKLMSDTDLTEVRPGFQSLLTPDEASVYTRLEPVAGLTKLIHTNATRLTQVIRLLQMNDARVFVDEFRKMSASVSRALQGDVAPPSSCAKLGVAAEDTKGLIRALGQILGVNTEDWSMCTAIDAALHLQDPEVSSHHVVCWLNLTLQMHDKEPCQKVPMIFRATSVPVLQYLLRRAGSRLVDEHERTPFHVVFDDANVPLLEALLSSWTSVQWLWLSRDTSTRTCLHALTEAPRSDEHASRLELIISTCLDHPHRTDLTMRMDDTGRTILHLIRHEYLRVLVLLLGNERLVRECCMTRGPPRPFIDQLNAGRIENAAAFLESPIVYHVMESEGLLGELEDLDARLQSLPVEPVVS